MTDKLTVGSVNQLTNTKDLPYARSSCAPIAPDNVWGIHANTFYKVDYSKVQTLTDLIALISALDLGFQQGTPAFERVKHLLNLPLMDQ